ncbi:MAG: hypothetical protein PHW53_01615 [Patescibacteria group bacterium]|nr:hypothetical protein [Patescibacteria group bacterium]
MKRTAAIVLVAIMIPACYQEPAGINPVALANPPVSAEFNPPFCGSHDDCNDGSICTNDLCLINRTCSNLTKYNWCGDNVYSDGGTCPAEIDETPISSCTTGTELRAACAGCTVSDEVLAQVQTEILPYYAELVSWTGYRPPTAVDRYYDSGYRTLNLALFAMGSGQTVHADWSGALVNEDSFVNEPTVSYLDDEGVPRTFEAAATHELAHAFLWSPFCGGIWNHGLVEFLEDIIVFDRIYIAIYKTAVEAVNSGAELTEVATPSSQPDRQIGYALFGTLWAYHGCGQECVRQILADVYDSWFLTDGEAVCYGPEFIGIVNAAVGHDVSGVVALSGLDSSEHFEATYDAIYQE